MFIISKQVYPKIWDDVKVIEILHLSTAENSSVYGTFSADACGITAAFYATKEDAISDLKKLQEFDIDNGYGLVQLGIRF